jgi:hypothetical protein
MLHEVQKYANLQKLQVRLDDRQDAHRCFPPMNDFDQIGNVGDRVSGWITDVVGAIGGAANSGARGTSSDAPQTIVIEQPPPPPPAAAPDYTPIILAGVGILAVLLLARS